MLERVREQLEADDQADELEERLSNLQKRLASKQAERDRAMRLYMRGLISEECLVGVQSSTKFCTRSEIPTLSHTR